MGGAGVSNGLTGAITFSLGNTLTCPLGPGSPDIPCHSKDTVIFTLLLQYTIYASGDTH